MIISTISAGGVLLVAAAVAQGGDARPPEAVITPLAGAGDFNAFVEGDARFYDGEMEGPLAVGGNLVLSGGYRVAIHTPGTTTAPGDALPSALIVNGRVDWDASAPDATLDVFDGYVKIGDMSGSAALDRDRNGAAQSTRVNSSGDAYEDLPHISSHVREPLDAVEGEPLDVAAAFAGFRSAAGELATCPATVALLTGNEDPYVNDLPENAEVKIRIASGRTNVLKIDAAELSRISDLDFLGKPTANGPLVVVVDTSGVGDDFDWRPPNLSGVGGAEAPYILWDFPTATAITLPSGGHTIEGSILAPNAKLTDHDVNNIEGQVVVRELVEGGGGTSAGELHQFPFKGIVDCEPLAPTSSPGVGSPQTPVPNDTSLTPSPSGMSPTPSPSGDGGGPSPSGSGPVPATSGPVPSDVVPHPPGPQPGAALPVTGNGLALPLALAGFALLVAGAVLTLRARR